VEPWIVFDVLAFPETMQDLETLLSAPIAAGPRDSTMFLGLGRVRHLGRWSPCGWHAAVHRAPDGGCWTHLYRVRPERGGRVLVLLERAVEGERRFGPVMTDDRAQGRSGEAVPVRSFSVAAISG
jgi:hypothetical protein